MIQMLEISDKDFKTAFMIVLHKAKVNTLELNGRKVLSRDIRIIFFKRKFRNLIIQYLKQTNQKRMEWAMTKERVNERED